MIDERCTSLEVKWNDKMKLFVAKSRAFPGISATGSSYSKAISALKYNICKLIGVRYGKQTK